MFDFLKKKIGGFIDGLTKKGEDNGKATEVEDEDQLEKNTIPEPGTKPEETEKQVEHAPQKSEKLRTKRTKTEATKKLTYEKPEQKAEPAKTQLPETPTKKPEPEKTIQQKPKERIKLGILSMVKSLVAREIEINENDVKEMLDSFELELLESDVDMEVAETIVKDIKSKLVGTKMPKEKLHHNISQAMREALLSILGNEKTFTIVQKLKPDGRSLAPLKIMFMGINGAGKTTTIAKVAKMLMGKKKKVVLAAADTFRAAAIEQLEHHALKLDVKIIKREYGSDPTSVAYDAVNYATAHLIDAVLIDTAGRQDTNISLINEVKKMARVIQPDLKIYIGESIAGNAIIEQIRSFDREIGIDGVILTKMDCDPKGGTMLSISKTTGIPIIYIGTGQRYEDLEEFSAEKIVDRILA